MKHFITAVCLTIIAIVWFTAPVARVLIVVWPIAAAALAVVLACGALSASIWIVGLGVRSLRKPPTPIQLLPPPAELPDDIFERVVNTVKSTLAPNDDEQGEQWASMTLRFAYIGNIMQFNSRRMTTERVVTRTAYDKYMSVLKDIRALAADRGGTRWSDGWNYVRLKAELNNGTLTPPYPAGDPPPVRWGTPGNAHTAHTAHTPDTHSTPGGVVYFGPMARR